MGGRRIGPAHPRRRCRLATEPTVAAPSTTVGFCPACRHCNPDAPRTTPTDIEIGKQAERSIPAVLRKLYFLARGNRRPGLLLALEELVRFIDTPGPPATTFLSLDREDQEIVRAGVGYLHDEPPPKVPRKGS